MALSQNLKSLQVNRARTRFVSDTTASERADGDQSWSKIDFGARSINLQHLVSLKVRYSPFWRAIFHIIAPVDIRTFACAVKQPNRVRTNITHESMSTHSLTNWSLVEGLLLAELFPIICRLTLMLRQINRVENSGWVVIYGHINDSDFCYSF